MSEEEAKTSGLYHLLFGNKDIPMTNEITVTPDTKNFLFAFAILLIAGAAITAYIARK